MKPHLSETGLYRLKSTTGRPGSFYRIDSQVDVKKMFKCSVSQFRRSENSGLIRVCIGVFFRWTNERFFKRCQRPVWPDAHGPDHVLPVERKKRAEESDKEGQRRTKRKPKHSGFLPSLERLGPCICSYSYANWRALIPPPPSPHPFIDNQACLAILSPFLQQFNYRISAQANLLKANTGPLS